MNHSFSLISSMLHQRKAESSMGKLPVVDSTPDAVSMTVCAVECHWASNSYQARWQNQLKLNVWVPCSVDFCFVDWQKHWFHSWFAMEHLGFLMNLTHCSISHKMLKVLLVIDETLLRSYGMIFNCDGCALVAVEMQNFHCSILF